MRGDYYVLPIPFNVFIVKIKMDAFNVEYLDPDKYQAYSLGM